MINVVTHDGKFHPDEIYACVLLNYFTGDELKITRTRDEKVIKKAQENILTYVIDVGDVYDKSKNNLDHHQSTFKEVGTNGDVLSSCGLMWHKLKDEVTLSDFIKNKIDEFTIRIDRHDNGVEYSPETEIISMYNFSDKIYTSNQRFRRALNVATVHFKNLMNMWLRFELTELMSIEILKETTGDIISTQEKIGVNKIFNSSDKLLLVTPRKEGEYTICSLNVTEEVDFSIRCPAPVEWRGLSDTELCEVAGLENLIFCHKSGFITIVKGELEDAMKIANEIVKQFKESENVNL